MEEELTIEERIKQSLYEIEMLASSSKRASETKEETFKRLYPYYMSIGMSYDEYWNGEPELVKYYREAYLLKGKQRNQELWLQGYYVYNAVATALGNGFRKKGTSPTSYIEKPIPMNRLEIKEDQEHKEKEQIAKIMSYVKGNLKENSKG